MPYHFRVDPSQVAAASVLSRVLEQAVPHKEVLKKYAVFVRLGYVSLSELTALEPAPKEALLSGIFAVIQACSRRQVRQPNGLMGSLPTGVGDDVFRALDGEYQRTHKLRGQGVVCSSSRARTVGRAACLPLHASPV